MTTTLGQGTTLAYFNSSYVTIGEVLDFSGISPSRDSIETTVLDAASNHRTFVGGLIDSGEISFEVLYNPADTDIAYIFGKFGPSATASSTEADQTLKLTFTDTAPTIYYMNGFFTKIDVKIAKDDIVKATIGFKVSGAITTVDPHA
jgi:hypothetical protein